MLSVDELARDAVEIEREQTAQVRLEADVAGARAAIAALKQRLVHSFDEPGGFVAIGDELRQATERLRLLEAELKTRKLEGRQEVWWTSSRRVSTGAAKLARSSRYVGRRGR
jgi:hypothetical protein